MDYQGFLGKREVLRAFLKGKQKPLAIALQECGEQAKLIGYTPIRRGPQTTVLVQRHTAATPHKIENNPVGHTLVKILGKRKKSKGLMLLNVCSSPRQTKNCDFLSLFFQAQGIAETEYSKLLIIGDFNVAHTYCGYRHTTPKGRDIWRAMTLHYSMTPTTTQEPGIAFAATRRRSFPLVR